MSKLLAMALVAVVGGLSSCKVFAPLDPETMKPSCARCPQNYYHGYSSTCDLCGQGATEKNTIDTCSK